MIARIVRCVIIALCLVMLTSCNLQGVNVARGNREAVGPWPHDERSSPSGDSNARVSNGKNELRDGTALVDIKLQGGSGRATIESPVTVITKDGISYATLVWSSKNYDYVLVDGVKYENENPGGNSTFTVPVGNLAEPFVFIADTTAMSKPHEIEYTIIWNAESDDGEDAEDIDNSAFGKRDESAEIPLVDGKEPVEKVILKHATGFDIFRYEGGKSLIRIYGVGDYTVEPERPVEKTYLVSTSAMDLVRQLGALGKVRFSPLRAADWSIEEVRRIMDGGRMLYAGKYRAPDYELLIANGCDLAIENTMIYHEPEVKEKLEELGIPVIVETSSYESDPLGRLEWIKVYGEIYGNSKEAEAFYEEKLGEVENLIASATDGGDKDLQKKTVACFYVSATGMINVRVPGDYITQMIAMAGGEYVPAESATGGKSGMGTLNMQMEDFLKEAKDADILLYNKTIDGDVESVDDLIAKNEVFSQFKAVKEGNVYSLEGDFFQKTTCMTDFITDLHDLMDKKDRDYAFFTRLE